MDGLGNTNALSGRLSGFMLGSTTSGSAWAYKALHPSDTVVGIGGVPDKSCLYTTFQNYMQQISINPTELLGIPVTGETNATPMWSMDIIQSPHPLYPLRIRLWLDHDSSEYRDFVVYNNQLGENLADSSSSRDFIRDLNKSFMSHYEKYRIAYQGVTINSTASDMFNQGTVTATQYTWPVTYNQNFRIDSLYDFFKNQHTTNIEPLTFNSTMDPILGTNSPSYVVDPNSVIMTMQCGSAVIRDKMKTYDELIQMPLAYTGVAKIGVYQPLKLTDFTWKKTDDLYYYISDSMYVAVNDPVRTTTNGLGPLTGTATSVSQSVLTNADSVLPVGVDSDVEVAGTRYDRLAVVAQPKGAATNGAAGELRRLINQYSFQSHQYNYGPLSNVWQRSTPFNNMAGSVPNIGYENLNLYPIPAFCGDKFGQISFRGLSTQNPLILTFRQGIETVVTPGSVLSMYTRPSMTPDEAALIAYSQMVNVLSDAWPAYYNDWNRLKKKLLEAWNWFRPIGAQMWKAAAPVALNALSSLII